MHCKSTKQSPWRGIAKVKNNLLGEAPLCLAFGSGFRDPLSNLQTTSAARSCFVDLPAFSLCLRFRLGVFGIARAFRALYLSNCFQVKVDALQKYKTISLARHCKSKKQSPWRGASLLGIRFWIPRPAFESPNDIGGAELLR